MGIGRDERDSPVVRPAVDGNASQDVPLDQGQVMEYMQQNGHVEASWLVSLREEKRNG